jgi:predicted nucleic acid-binding protein
MIVVDARVAVKWFLPEPLNEVAESILRENEVRIAPEHILVEVGNTLLKAHRAQQSRWITRAMRLRLWPS